MALSKMDSVLVAQARNFSTVLAADPLVYGQSPSAAADVTAAVAAFADAFDALVEARANGVRSEQMTALKNTNRQSMLNLIRPIYAAVQASRSISDAAKIALGVHLRPTHPKPQPIPDFAPVLSVQRVDGNTVTLRVRDSNQPGRNARPALTSGITLFTYVGDAPPADPAAFAFERNTGRVEMTVTFPASVPIGARVWFCASFFNNRKQSGPIGRPIGATLGAGSMMATAMPAMDIAA